jgi:hypothetical protein
MSWQTRQLSTFIAGGYMTDGKHGNPAFDAAQKLAFDEIEAAQIEEADFRSARGGNLIYAKDAEGKDVLDSRGMPVVAEIVTDLPDLKPTSFESFMGSFGNPYSWKGR